MGVSNEGIVNRRQLLVRAGSLMKMSWRKSKEELIDFDEDNDNSSSSLRKKRSQKRNLSVRFNNYLDIVANDRKEPMSEEEITNRWYQSGDYNRFKKDTILTSLNYINARRASKPFDERINCIWGIEEMCYLTPIIPKRNIAEKKHVFKVIREEQARQKKEWQQKQQKKTENENDTDSQRRVPDLEKFRSVSVGYSKAGRDRAVARGIDYARSVQRSLGVAERRSSSRKNLFASFRSQSAIAA